VYKTFLYSNITYNYNYILPRDVFPIQPVNAKRSILLSQTRNLMQELKIKSPTPMDKGKKPKHNKREHATIVSFISNPVI
jgi:hypothetical protein